MSTEELPAPAAVRAPRERSVRDGLTATALRLCPPLATGRWTWLGPLLVTVLAGVLRFWRLDEPHAVVFDETYYVKDAYSLLRFGYEREYIDDADAALLAGQTDLFDDDAAFVVHPPVGKWVIAAGQAVVGLSPLGWRVGVAVLGTASVFVLCRVAMRMTRSVLLGCLAGLLLAVDGLHLVMSRTALLDGVLAFFLLVAFACLLVDRDAARLRLAGLAGDRGLVGAARLGWRPWRLAAGAALGLAVATKWNALAFIAAFGLLSVLWDAGARKSAGDRRPYRRALRRDALPAFGALVGIPLVVYLASWSGWLVTDGGWSRNWAAGRGSTVPFVPDALRSLWHYHAEILRFHTGLTADHPYESSPWGWPVLARPVAFYSRTLSGGEGDCRADECVREVLGIGTPALWWACAAAGVYMVWRWAGTRDWRAGAVLAGIAAGWLPWFAYSDRPRFLFYTVTFLPFLILGLVLALGDVLGPGGASRRRRAIGATIVGALTVLVVLNFFYILPILTAETLPRPEWMDRMWFRSWI